MKAKRKHQPKQRRIGLLIHTALFFFGTAFYMMLWSTTIPMQTSTFPQLVGFLLTWLFILVLHTVSVPFFKWANMGESLWLRPATYRSRHFWLDVNVAFFMATFGLIDAWVISQMIVRTASDLAMNRSFGLMVLLLPIWLVGVLAHGHRVLVQDVAESSGAEAKLYTRHLEDNPQLIEDVQPEELKNYLEQNR